MNKDTVKIFLPMVKAFAEGKTIQYLNGYGRWEDTISPVFSSCDIEKYRIKPELMEFFAITNDDKTDILSRTFKTKEETETEIDLHKWEHYNTIVHLREVE